MHDPDPASRGLDPRRFLVPLSSEEIGQGRHREFVGGLWDEVGRLQLDFLVGEGLLPAHRLVDLGCGSLRGGVHLARYLEPGHYFGIDVNASLLEAGRLELALAGLDDRTPTLLVNDRFELHLFGTAFDYALAQSLFTHLPANQVLRALVRTREALAPGGRLYATYFEAPFPAHVEPIVHDPGGIRTELDCDPYHYSAEELRCLARFAGLRAEQIGAWGHPRGQKMMLFRRA